MKPEDKILLLARVQKPHGFQGELRVTRRGELLDQYSEGDALLLYKGTGIRDGFIQTPVFFGEYILETYQSVDDNFAYLRFQDQHTHDQAMNLKGLYIGIPLAEACERFHDENSPYLFEYVGLKVVVDQKEFGVVDRVEEAGPVRWLVVVSSEQEWMVPLDAPFVGPIDSAGRKIEIGSEIFTIGE